jgi:DNA replication protein DnaC
VNCSLCNDTGWKYLGPESERRVTRCGCRAAQRSERLLQMARIPRRYQHCEISEFETRINGEEQISLAKAKFSAQKFVEEYPLDKTGLLFIGPVGVGKTHLAVGIIQELIRRKGVACLFYEYRELLREIQHSYNASAQATEMDFLRPAMTTEVLVLDELGATKPSEWVWDTVSLILNTRYNENLTTILTTNFEDLPPFDPANTDVLAASPAARAHGKPTLGDRITERMRSRLHEMCRKVEIQGEDFRQKFKKATYNAL